MSRRISALSAVVFCFMLFLPVASPQEWKAGTIRVSAYSAIGCVNAHIKKLGWKKCLKEASAFFLVGAGEQASIELFLRGRMIEGKFTHSLAMSFAENRLDGMDGWKSFCRYRTDYMITSLGYDFCKGDFQPRIRMAQIAAAAETALMGRTKFNWKKSFSLGAPIFESSSSSVRGARGMARFGVVVMNNAHYNHPDPIMRETMRRRLDRHEGMHAIIQLRRQYLCSYLIDRPILGKDFHNFPLAIGQDLCFIPFAVGGERSVWEMEADAFDSVLMKSVAAQVADLLRRGKLFSPDVKKELIPDKGVSGSTIEINFQDRKKSTDPLFSTTMKSTD